MTVVLYEVGGCVRDELLGLRTKDIDYTVTASSYDEMLDYLRAEGFGIYLEKPEYLTVTAHFPKGVTEFGGRKIPFGMGADFVLSRKEGSYHDGRHPDSVEPGTLYDDLKRRDFTVNSLARDADGILYDYFGGLADLDKRLLRAVGSAEERIREDALRALRAVRFSITKQFNWDGELIEVMLSDYLPELVAKVSLDRRRDELTKCFKHDSLLTMRCLAALPNELVRAMLADGLWLEPTNKRVKGR